MRAKIEASSRFTNFSRVSNIVELGNRNMKKNFLNRIFFKRIVMIRTKGREYFACQYVENRENASAMEI